MAGNTIIPTDAAPLEGKLSTADELRQIKKAHNELAKLFFDHTAAADTAYPGADRRRHYDHHVDIEQKVVDRRELMRKLVPQILGGVIMALLGLIAAALVFYAKNGVR